MTTAILAVALSFGSMLENYPPVVLVAREKQGGHGIGAGVIVDARGYVVTCAHCTGRQDEVIVAFFDGTAVKDVKVVARDLKNDLALLKLPDEWRYLPVRLASEPLRPLDRIIVWGHPNGYRFSLSAGVVSALGGKVFLSDGESMEGLIQTDAAINSGNSGGPLLNARRELVGIAVCIDKDAPGVGFAIHVDRVRAFLARHLP